MTLDTLIRDPIFQLNLLLWMARDQPAQTPRVTPLFFHWGYRFVMVETPVPLPPTTVSAVEKSGLDITLEPEPEMILGHQSQSHALYLEAKRESFSPQSTNARQARGHLLVAGAIFKEIVTPYQSARLCYALPEDRRALMEACLEALKAELRAKQLFPADTSIHGFAATREGVTYVWDAGFAALVGTNSTRELILKSEGDETDPSPLLLVYSAEDYCGGNGPDFAREVLVKQVWAQLLCAVHVCETSSPIQFKADTILNRTTDEVFGYLGRQRQKNLCRLVTERFFTPIRDAWNKAEFKRDDIQVALNGSVLTITLRDDFAKSIFTDWLEDAKKMRPDYSALSKEEQTSLPLEGPDR